MLVDRPLLTVSSQPTAGRPTTIYALCDQSDLGDQSRKGSATA
jgi:hypothetical protein